jgi:hypothetical protein
MINACAAIALALLIATPASPVPSSLRSESDLSDLTETFLRNLVANDVKGAYRLAARFWSLSPAELASRINEGASRRADLRKTLGLSLGYELVASETVGERVRRIVALERFDKGALVWRFLFYRADTSWQLVDVSESADLGTLFGTP